MDWQKLNPFKKSLDAVAMPVNTGKQGRLIHEPFSGAWQHNQEIHVNDSLTSYAVYACVSLICKDVGKLKIHLKDENTGIKLNTKLDIMEVLAKPNDYQNWQQFIEAWTHSKTTRGNTYVLKVFDEYGYIEKLIVLNPDLTTPCVTPSGDVWYEVVTNPLSTDHTKVRIPADFIIHDRQPITSHPLIGLSPLSACIVAASTGTNIQTNAKDFFGNMSRPSGLLVSPNPIGEDAAKEAKRSWDSTYGRGGIGGTAILGNGLTYSAMTIPASDSQMLEILKLSGEIVCTSFQVPAFKVGIGSIPVGSKVADLNEIYYSDCLQSYLESIENLLNYHLDLPLNTVLEFDIQSLIRMDQASLMLYLKDGTSSGIYSPNEARAKLGLAPTNGGDSPMIQQQNYSLEAIAKRDSKEDPFNTTTKATTSPTEAIKAIIATNTTDKALDSPNEVFDSLWVGTFKTDKEYNKGSFITHKGSLWHCDNKHLGNFNYDNFTQIDKGWA